MTLQVYIDDSTTAEETFVLAGYISTAEKWAQFSDEWQELLDREPKWRRFKVSRVFNSIRYGHLEDGASNRVIEFYRVIEKFVDKSVAVVVPIAALKKAASDFGLPEMYGNPYWVGWKTIVQFCVEWLHESGTTGPIDFIFDDQTEAGTINSIWDGFSASFPMEHRNLVPNRPRFRREEEFLPLQAADMYAWWVRRRHGELKTSLIDGLPYPWNQTRNGPTSLMMQFDKRGLRKQARKDAEELKYGLGPSFKLSASYWL